MNSKVTYYQQISYCGKPQCSKCREGIGHGPYWYAYRTENGRTTRTYIGKHLPADVPLAAIQDAQELYASSSVTVRIYALGQLRLERLTRSGWQQAPDSIWQQQAVRSLLSFLVSSPERRLSQAQAQSALWPHASAEVAAARFARALHNLEQLLEPSRRRAAPPALLRLEDDVLILADQLHVWVDADAFAELLTQVTIDTDPALTESLLEQAANLYTGDFLPEERRSPWVLARREQLQQDWRSLLLKLADLRGAHGASTGALDLLDRLLAVDPTNEAAIQRLMRTLVRLKRRAEALRAYQRLASTLQQTVHTLPSEETRRLYEAIKGDEQNAPLSSSPLVFAGANDQESAQPPRFVYRWQTGRSHQHPLVGRESELEVLRQILRTTEQTSRTKPAGQKRASALPLDTQRRAQYAILLGGAGLGKTRLAEEIGREAQERDWAIVWSRVYAQESNIPYRLWVEILRNMLAHDLWQRQEISKRSSVYAPLSALLPELYAQLPRLLPLPPEQEQQRLWEAVLELFLTTSEHTPLLIVLDDLQWADVSSCELLSYLARRLSGYPVMFVATCRDSELSVDHPLRALIAHLQREHGIVTVPIQPLSDEQIGTLIAHVPETMLRYIQMQAAGNPFFAEELARSIEVQFLTPPQEAQVTRRDIPYPLPDTIAAVLNLRISRLSKACQRLLGTAAVLGGSFEFNVISAMEAGGKALSDEDVVLDLLDEALQAGVLTEEGSGTRINYHFWHPLLVSHLYDGLSATKRVLLHRRAAETLRGMFVGREEEGAATITHHLVAGGAEPEQIARYAELAGNSAYVLSAYPEAERYYRLAVENFAAEQKGPADQDAQVQLGYLLERLGECVRVQGKFDEARQFYQRALDVHQRQHVFASNEEYLYETQIRALLWSEIGWTWHAVGNSEQAQHYCDRGKQALRDAGVQGGFAWARLHVLQSYIYWLEGKYAEARDAGTQALRLFEEILPRNTPSTTTPSLLTRTRRTLEGDPVDLARVHRFLGSVANSIGGVSETLAHLNTALEILERYNHKREIAHVSCNVGHAHLERAEHEQARSYFKRSLALAEQLGDTPLIAVVHSNLAELAAREGDLPEAEVWLRRSIAQAEQINDQIYVSNWNANLAIVLQDQGKLSEAGAAIYRALMIGRAKQNVPCIGAALLSLGHLRIAQAIVIAPATETMPAEEVAAALTLQAATRARRRFLLRARSTLRRILSLAGQEADTSAGAQFALAQVSLLLGDAALAQQEAELAIEQARQYELAWLLARAHGLMGRILATRGQEEQARQHFEQALQIFNSCGMRLDYARALYYYAISLPGAASPTHRQALSNLQEARHIFRECHAFLDLALSEGTTLPAIK